MDNSFEKAQPEFLLGGGEMGERIRSYDWANTSLGVPELWPNSLKTIVRIMLTSQQPIWIGWGKELIKLYNDPYKTIVGGKHPTALGLPASVVWSDIWEAVGPRLERVMSKNEGTYDESLLLKMERYGYVEETYYTFSYSPVPDDNGQIGGIFCANTDDTQRIIGERQLKLLGELASQTVNTRALDEMYDKIKASLSTNSYDLPFTMLYELDKDSNVLRLKSSTGISPLHEAAKEYIYLGQSSLWPFEEAILSNKATLVNSLSDRWPNLPSGSWDRPPHQAILVPISQYGNRKGALIVGLNPYRMYDEGYQGFIHLIARQIDASIANCYAYEEERKRSEALEEIDKAKTVFFSNVSHELRTPLTLMLGPIEDSLNDPATTALNKERMDLSYRNCLRLLKMVNTLLDFSRIEAGRMQGVFRETDIVAYTRNLGSVFRSAIERKGIAFRIETEEIPFPVYLDRTMWERIIFNLISNALKYTLRGEITLMVKSSGYQAEVRVKDTGLGIPKGEIAKLFTRFHRIENAEGRTHEGTGIGLALTYELVKLHGGTIQVESILGEGSTFILSLPGGKEHLPQDRFASEEASEAVSMNALQEMEMEPDIFLFPENIPYTDRTLEPTGGKERILIADDNADMRFYLTQLLSPTFDVIAVTDGLAALKAMETQTPALVLSDIMMPKLDGIGLLNKLRSNDTLKNIPIILLSARAGEEAKVQGIEAGADDYLVKPFSAKELLARVTTTLKIFKQRTEAEKNLRNLFNQVPVGICILNGSSMIIDLANEKALEIWGKTHAQVMEKPILVAMPELRNQGFGQILENVFNTGESFIAKEMPVELMRNGKNETLHINFIFDPLRNTEGQITSVVGAGIDVTELVEARMRVERNVQELDDKNQQLTRINNDLDNFIYTASHDLKAPVSNLEGLFTTLLDEMEIQGELSVISAMIWESFERFRNTIQDLTDITKIQKEGTGEVEVVKFEEILNEIVLNSHTQFKNYGAELVVDLKVKEIKFSKKNLRSILYNFISNSIKYSSEERKPLIRISTEKQNGFVLLQVEDNGLGIPDVNQKNVFQMFKRFHDHVEGSGIGLYIVKRIVDNAGGKIEIASEVGKGTTFTVFFKEQ